jgi:RNA polymerase sigma factor (TIGR02999 family)
MPASSVEFSAQDDRVSAGSTGRGYDLSAECYGEMRRAARRLLAGDRQRLAFDPTELAHDAILRLIQSDAAKTNDQAHALALGARTMRRILIDEVRRASAAKRHLPTVLPTILGGARTTIDVEALDAALKALDVVSPEHATVVELRFSLGMTVEETAAALGVAPRTVKRRWQSARAWLHDHLADDDADPTERGDAPA